MRTEGICITKIFITFTICRILLALSIKGDMIYKNVACMEDMQNPGKDLIGIYEGNRTLGRPDRKW